jgi:hypothetical protein
MPTYAPLAVGSSTVYGRLFTVRTYATTAPYEPEIVHTFRVATNRNCSSTAHNQNNEKNMAQVG